MTTVRAAVPRIDLQNNSARLFASPTRLPATAGPVFRTGSSLPSGSRGGGVLAANMDANFGFVALVMRAAGRLAEPSPAKNKNENLTTVMGRRAARS